jgi:Holliday junction resolvasome RuvABC endonuclease subunit
MNTIDSKQFRVLAIAPVTRGFGFAVLEGQDTLVNWGVKVVSGKGNKNAKLLPKVEELIAHYQPDVLVMEDASAKGSLRRSRIQRLVPQIIKVAKASKANVKLFSREQVMKLLVPDGQGTKHDLAEIVAGEFPEQLGSKLPPKRTAAMRENYQMGIFDAVGLVMVVRLKQAMLYLPSTNPPATSSIFQ